MTPTTICHSESAQGDFMTRARGVIGLSWDVMDEPFPVLMPYIRAASAGIIRDTCPQCLDRVHPEALVLTDAGVMCEDCAEEVARDD